MVRMNVLHPDTSQDLSSYPESKNYSSVEESHDTL